MTAQQRLLSLLTAACLLSCGPVEPGAGQPAPRRSIGGLWLIGWTFSVYDQGTLDPGFRGDTYLHSWGYAQCAGELSVISQSDRTFTANVSMEARGTNPPEVGNCYEGPRSGLCSAPGVATWCRAFATAVTNGRAWEAEPSGADIGVQFELGAPDALESVTHCTLLSGNRTFTGMFIVDTLKTMDASTNATFRCDDPLLGTVDIRVGIAGNRR